MSKIGLRERLSLLLQGAATLMGGGVEVHRTKTVEEYMAWVDAAVNDPAAIEARKNLKPAFTYYRSTGELRRNNE